MRGNIKDKEGLTDLYMMKMDDALLNKDSKVTLKRSALLSVGRYNVLS